MKRVADIFERSFSSYKSHWNSLRNNIYTPNTNRENITLRDGELEIEYKKGKGKIIKKVLHRHIDSDEQELTYPQSQIDEKAFDYFIKQDQNHDNNKSIKHSNFLSFHQKHKMTHSFSRPFTTLVSREQKLEKKLYIKPDITVSTSIGDKVVSGISLHKGKAQVNAFKDSNELLLSRVQKSEYEGISTALLRLGGRASLTDNELMMQYDLYCIEKDLYNKIILRTSKLGNDVEVASHFTGMLEVDEKGKAVFEYLEEGLERPKTVYNPRKGKFVSMESHGGNTASLEFIAYKTQKFAGEYELIFIPKTHKSIKQIVKVCEALLSIKNTSTEDPIFLNLILKKHGLSSEEIAVELIEEINKHDTSNGIFHINTAEFQQKNPQIVQFITEATFFKKSASYKLEISNEKDIHNEPLIIAHEQLYEDPIDYKVIGNSNDFNNLNDLD